MNQTTQIKKQSIERKLLEVEPLIARIAQRIFNSIPSYSLLEYDDLYSVGMTAAFKAIPIYDPEKGASLKTFISNKAKWAMYDELRVIDNLSKNHRCRIKAGLEEDIQCLPLLEVSKSSQFDNSDADENNYALEFQISKSLDPVFDEVLELELKELVESKIKDNRQLARLYIKSGMSLKKVGEVVGLSEGRISQIVTEATKHIKPLLNS